MRKGKICIVGARESVNANWVCDFALPPTEAKQKIDNHIEMKVQVKGTNNYEKDYAQNYFQQHFELY